MAEAPNPLVLRIRGTRISLQKAYAANLTGAPKEGS
jgi:hypothetical protein